MRYCIAVRWLHQPLGCLLHQKATPSPWPPPKRGKARQEDVRRRDVVAWYGTVWCRRKRANQGESQGNRAGSGVGLAESSPVGPHTTCLAVRQSFILPSKVSILHPIAPSPKMKARARQNRVLDTPAYTYEWWLECPTQACLLFQLFSSFSYL